MRYSRTAVPAALLLLFSIELHASAPWDSTAAMPRSGPAPLDTIWSDTKTFFTDAALLFGRPLGFDGRDWGTAGGVLAATGGAMLVDEKIRAELGTGAHVESRFVDAANALGTPLPALAIAVPLYVGGLAADAPRFRVAGRRVVQAVAYAGVITGLVKVVVGRHRPFLGDGAFRYEGPSLRDEYNSLPSGHSTLAFALCSTLAAEIDDPWATVGLYSLATLTAATRIYVDRHWGSDVILGAAIGTACGYGVVHLDDERTSHSSLRIYPSPGGLTAILIF